MVYNAIRETEERNGLACKIGFQVKKVLDPFRLVKDTIRELIDFCSRKVCVTHFGREL